MSIKQLQEYALKTSETHDSKYNRGRKHIIDGLTYTEEAHYFRLVENIRFVTESENKE